MIILYVDIRTT